MLLLECVLCVLIPLSVLWYCWLVLRAMWPRSLQTLNNWSLLAAPPMSPPAKTTARKKGERPQRVHSATLTGPTTSEKRTSE